MSFVSVIDIFALFNIDVFAQIFVDAFDDPFLVCAVSHTAHSPAPHLHPITPNIHAPYHIVLQ